MHSARFGLLVSIMLLNVPVWARQAQTPVIQTQSATTLPPATKDPQAVSVLTQALGASGGIPAITAITDYTATGTGTWYQTSDHTFEGAVTINGTASGQLRFDAHLPAGVRSYAVNRGRSLWKNEDERLTQAPAPDTRVPSSDAFPYKPPMFAGGFASPHIQIAAVLNDSLLEVSYKGSVQIDGRPVHEIQVRRLLPGSSDPNDPLAEYSSMDFFIDASTYQVVMTQDVVPKHVIHQLRYSDYRPVNAVVVPFAITEFMGSQQIWAIHLDQISYNSGLQDSSFDLQ